MIDSGRVPRCSRDTYPESCITKYTSIRREKVHVFWIEPNMSTMSGVELRPLPSQGEPPPSRFYPVSEKRRVCFGSKPTCPPCIQWNRAGGLDSCGGGGSLARQRARTQWGAEAEWGAESLCRPNMVHMRQARSDSALGVQVFRTS